MSAYHKQLRSGKHLVYENMPTATSCLENGVKSMAHDPSLNVVTADQSLYGLLTPSEPGGMAPARKNTTPMTSSRNTADMRTKRWDGSHQHQQLVNGRGRDAAVYHVKLPRTILQGMKLTRDAERAMQGIGKKHRSGTIPSEKAEAVHTSNVQDDDGGGIPIIYSMVNFRSKSVD